MRILRERRLQKFREAYLEAEKIAGLYEAQAKSIETLKSEYLTDLDNALMSGNRAYAEQLASSIAELESQMSAAKEASTTYHKTANLIYTYMMQMETRVSGNLRRIEKPLKMLRREGERSKLPDYVDLERATNELRKLQDALEAPKSRISGKTYIPKRAKEILEERIAKLETQSELERVVREKAGIAESAISA